MAMNKALKKLEKAWKRSKPKDSEGFGKFPLSDGKYLMRIGKSLLGKSKSSGRIQVNFPYTVASGKKKGIKVTGYQGLDNDEGFAYLKGMLKKLGIKPPKSILKLQAVLDKLEDELVWINVQTSGDFHNMYIDKLADEEDLEDESEDDEEDEDEDEEEDEDEDDEEEDEEDDEEDDDEDDDDDGDDDSDDDDGDEDDEDEDDEDEEDDEEDEKKKPKRKKKKKIVKKRLSTKSKDDDEDEDEDDEDDDF